MANFGIKSTVPGYPINTNRLTVAGDVSDPTNLGFSSSFFAYKVLATGTASSAIASTAGTARSDTITINHSYGYVPLAMLYYSVDGGITYWPSGAETEGASAGTPLRSAQIQSSSTNIVIEIITTNIAAYTINCRWIIYAEVGV
jgi:hypothetical protein